MKRTLARIAAFFALGLFLALPGHQAIGQSASGYPLNSVAGWDITKVAYVPVDNDSGSDTANCLIVATAGSTLSPSGHTCKTLEHVLRIIPRNGNGRSLVILLKPRSGGATYRNIANSADEALDLTGVSGYSYLGARGSDALIDDAVERVTLGGLQGQVGPGVGGAWTVAGGATTTTMSVSSGALTAEPGLLGMRVRFDAATTTVALRGAVAFVAANSSSAITVGVALGTAPAAGDIFYIEQAGVRLASFLVSQIQPITAAGLAITGSSSLSANLTTATQVNLSFFEASASTTNNTVGTSGTMAGNITISSSYSDETVTLRSSASGLRSAGGFSVSTSVAAMSALAFSNSSATVSLTALVPTFGGSGSYFANGPIVHINAGFDQHPTVGSTTSATIQRMRIAGGTLTVGGSARITSVACSTSAASCVKLSTTSVPPERPGYFTLNDCAGTAATQGVDATGLRGATVLFETNTSNSCTGASGDVALPGNGSSIFASFSGFALTNLIDIKDNRYIDNALTSGPALVSQGAIVTNKSGGALAVGNLVRSNATSGQVTCAQADSSAHAGGGPCVMVTPPANNADGYMVCSGTPYVLFDGTPAIGSPAYVSTGTSCKATTTVPAVSGSNRKLRVGAVYTGSGSTGRVSWYPESVSVAADGNP